jgi:hypothetical protein
MTDEKRYAEIISVILIADGIEAPYLGEAGSTAMVKLYNAIREYKDRIEKLQRKVNDKVQEDGK